MTENAKKESCSTGPAENANKSSCASHAPKADAGLGQYAAVLIEYPAENQFDSVWLQNKICSIVGEFLRICKIDYRFECYLSYICCYLSFEQYNLRVLADALKQQLANLLKGFPFNIYYSECLKSPQEVQPQVDYLIRHFSYSLLYGYMERHSYTLIQKSEQSGKIPAPGAGVKIAAYLDQKDYGGLVRYIEEQKTDIMTWDHLTGAPYSSHEVYLFMESLLYSLKFFFRLNSWKSPLNEATLPELLSGHPGIQEYCRFLEVCITEFETATRPRPSGRSQQFMDMLTLYIEENLSTVTLGSAAEHFHLTNAYISRTFKKYTGENFSDYVSSRKLHKAAQMLNGNASIGDISSRLGYSSPAYFLAKFKEKFGMTPSAYRRREKTYEASPVRKVPKDMPEE